MDSKETQNKKGNVRVCVVQSPSSTVELLEQGGRKYCAENHRCAAVRSWDSQVLSFAGCNMRRVASISRCRDVVLVAPRKRQSRGVGDVPGSAIKWQASATFYRMKNVAND